jgi:hypothetical protein
VVFIRNVDVHLQHYSAEYQHPHLYQRYNLRLRLIIFTTKPPKITFPWLQEQWVTQEAILDVFMIAIRLQHLLPDDRPA